MILKGWIVFQTKDKFSVCIRIKNIFRIMFGEDEYKVEIRGKKMDTSYALEEEEFEKLKVAWKNYLTYCVIKVNYAAPN